MRLLGARSVQELSMKHVGVSKLITSGPSLTTVEL